MKRTAYSTGSLGSAIALALFVVCPATAQLNQNCTVSVLNRNVQVNADGSWVLPNIPANIGQVKVRATCVQNGVTISRESAFFTVPANNAVNLPAITLGSGSQIPVSLALTPTAQSFTSLGQTVQLAVTAIYPDNSTKDVTQTGTGTVVLQATNDGATGMVTVRVAPPGNSHGGIPDDWAIANGLNPNNPTMPYEDPDRDGLTNLQEYQLGTDPNKADTDGDGLSDGDEVNKYHTHPLLADTDGDCIPDGVEIQNGTDPLNAASYDLTKAVASFKVTPGAFELIVNALNPNSSLQLTVTGKLIDGKTTIDLTSKSKRTSYSSSNLNSCTFGSQDGRVFAAAPGACTITVTNSSFFSVTVAGSVSNFAPVEVAALNIPGSSAIDVGGAFGYVAAGSNGLVIVDLNNRASPRIRGSALGIGNALAVRVAGQ